MRIRKHDATLCPFRRLQATMTNVTKKMRLRRSSCYALLAAMLVHSLGCNPTSTPNSATGPNDAPSLSSTGDATALGSASLIASIQGSGAQSESIGLEVEVTGVVTATFFDRDELGGFFVQSLGQTDGASDAIFVAAIVADLQVGQSVELSGVVAEIDGMTSLKPHTGKVLDIEAIEGDAAIVPVTLPPLDQGVDWETLEGMVVKAPYPMFVVDTYDLARRGRIVLASEMQRVPTDASQPDRDGFRQAERAIRANRITLDDGVTAQNRFPIPLVPGLGSGLDTIRFGSKVTELTGIVTESNGDYYVIPTKDLKLESPPRPKRPTLGDSNLVVASFNVLNFFTTLDNGSNGARGADNEAELQRQREKIVAAILELDADVIGLMELENSLAAEQDLVEALNQRIGSEAYSGCGLPPGFAESPGGGDKIRVGILYRRDRVECTQPITLIDDDAFYIARTPLVQEFRRSDGEERFSLIVNHFKSKGARDAKGKDLDQKDGQAAYNETRMRQAKAVASHVDGMVQAGQSNVLVIGDLNAYRFEDPIDALRDAGLVDLMETKCNESFPYTFVYYGQAGSLDQSFATSSLADEVTAVATWHINAAEPRFLDYNTEYNPKSLYRPDPFRSSDHDPVLIGIQLD